MKLRVWHKLSLAFGAICLLTALLIGFQLYRFSETLHMAEQVMRNDVGVAEEVRDITRLQSEMRAAREAAINGAALARAENRPFDIGAHQQRYSAMSQRLMTLMERLSARANDRSLNGVTPERRLIWGEAATAADQLGRTFRQIIENALLTLQRLERGQVAEALAQRDALEALRRETDERLEQFDTIIRRLSDAGHNELEHVFRDALRNSFIAFGIVLSLAGLVGYLISRSLTARLGTAIGFVSQVGRGDLTNRVVVPGTDELATLGEHLNAMAENLRTVAGTSRAAAENVHAATAQIRASTQQQAASVAEQLAAVEETTATLSEITESGAQISRRAQEVARGALGAAAASDSGLKAVTDTIQVMDAIREQAEAVAENIVMLSERTQAIGEIIVTVNDIAERSHLLALNAAIEAAAAGEHGRTFAVVAGEIKSLADQAKEATAQVRSNLSEIQHGINASVMLTEEAVKRVATGKRQTDATESTIREMAENIQESVQAFQQIVAGTNQQQIGLEQVIQALQNIRQASTQTAAGTRELEGAAANLNTLGQTLVDAVRNYRV